MGQQQADSRAFEGVTRDHTPHGTTVFTFVPQTWMVDGATSTSKHTTVNHNAHQHMSTEDKSTGAMAHRRPKSSRHSRQREVQWGACSSSSFHRRKEF